MSQEEVDRALVLVDLHDEPTGNLLKVWVNVASKSIRLELPAGMGDWHIAVSDADIQLQAVHGEIVEYSAGTPIPVNYTVETTKETGVGAKLEPKIAAAKDVEGSVGDVHGERKRTEDLKSEYSANEYSLSASRATNVVTWQQRQHRGAKVFADYSVFDLKLWANCKWENDHRKGTLKLQTSPLVYGANGQKFSPVKGLVVMLVLHFRNVAIYNERGVNVSFEYAES